MANIKKLFYRPLAYLRYRRRAKSIYSIHSPFVYDLIDTVVAPSKHYYSFTALELLRKKMLLDTTHIKINDMGAGATTKPSTRTIKSIAKTALKRPQYASLLFRLADKYKCHTMLEMGTSLGITTGYLAKACKTARIYTIEGCPSIAQVATKNLQQLNANNVKLTVGNFDQVLDEVLQSEQTFDLIFIDGNHRKEPLLRYFNQILPQTHPDTVLIIDDIHWSAEMEEAWKTIQQDPRVVVTIDLFEMGLLFFKTGMQRQHFTIRY